METEKQISSSMSATSSTASDAATSAGAVKPNEAAQDDAIALLKSDHRAVEELFKKFKQAKSNSQKQQIARQVCSELVTHTELEEELFYPACREKNVDVDALDEAQVEHDGAKVLITDLMALSAESPFYDAKVTVLSEYIKHHVREEEKSGSGIFAKAKKAGVDMGALGQRLRARKEELKQQAENQGLHRPELRSLECFHQPAANQEQSTMDRQHDRDRDDHGRFMSDDDRNENSSSARGGYSSRERDDRDEGYRSSARDGGRYSSHSSNQGGRDEHGRFMSDGDNGSSSRGGGRYASRSSNDHDRDERGRFVGDDDNRSSGRSGSGYSSRSTHDRDRDESGRFMNDGDNGSSSRNGGRYSSRSSYDRERERDENGRFTRDDDYGSSSREGGRYSGSSYDRGDRFPRDENDRFVGGDSGRYRRDENDMYESPREGRYENQERASRASGQDGRSSRSSRAEHESRRGSQSDNDDHRGWYGDSRGHSEAARRGWRHRE